LHSSQWLVGLLGCVDRLEVIRQHVVEVAEQPLEVVSGRPGQSGHFDVLDVVPRPCPAHGSARFYTGYWSLLRAHWTSHELDLSSMDKRRSFAYPTRSIRGSGDVRIRGHRGRPMSSSSQDLLALAEVIAGLWPSASPETGSVGLAGS
jgi:hypothetical protein